TGALLRPTLGQHELAAALEAEPERGRLRALLPGAEVPQPPRRHQVDQQHELAVIRREEEPLRAALGPGQPPSLERGERRVVRLQCRHVRRPGLRHRKRAYRLVERSEEHTSELQSLAY